MDLFPWDSLEREVDCNHYCYATQSDSMRAKYITTVDIAEVIFLEVNSNITFDLK